MTKRYSAAATLLGIQLSLPALAAAGAAAAVVAGAALLRDTVGLGRMLYDSLQVVARRAHLDYAPPVDACMADVK